MLPLVLQRIPCYAAAAVELQCSRGFNICLYVIPRACWGKWLALNKS